MGVSTDGILVYGIAFEDEEVPAFLEEFMEARGDGYPDFDEYLDSLSGLPAYGEPGHDFTASRKWREAQPADLVKHCSYEYPMYILAVRDTKSNAWRGTPVEIVSLDVDPEKVVAFKEWCAARDIVGEPKWLLCSMWG